MGWIDRMTKQTKAETDRLELELKGYKNNLIKESIRVSFLAVHQKQSSLRRQMGYDDLGQHYHRIGDLPNSTKAFTRMRDFCTTPSHVIIMKLRLLNVSIEQKNWIAVQTNVQSIRQGGHKQAEVEKITAKLSAAMGLANLASGNYEEATKEFLATDPRMATAKMEDPTDEESYNEVMTPNDIAVYGGLCALASMSRDDLQKKVLDNASFRNYLELEPHIRRAVSFFVSGKYASCLAILNNYKADYLLDVHLQQHVDLLYAEVRTKAIRQYFIPFSHVKLAALATAFDTDQASIEAELTSMIKKEQLDARIDLVDRVLLARKVNPRTKVTMEALRTAKQYERTAHLRLMRMEVLNAGLDIKSKKGRPADTGGWFSPGGHDDGLGNGLAGDVFMGKSLRSGLRTG